MAGVRDILLFSPASTTTAAASTTPYHPNIALMSSGEHHHHINMTPLLLSPSPFLSSNIPAAPPADPSSSSSSKKLRPSPALQGDMTFKESLPRHVRAPATFRCVRLTAVGGGSEAEFAYQAVVKIGGHVFRGVLYQEGRARGVDGAADGNSNDSSGSVQDVSEWQIHRNAIPRRC